MKIFRILMLLIFGSFLTGCAAKKHKDIAYPISATTEKSTNPKLNVFVPRNSTKAKMPVMIFVHGGNWNTGNKNQYGFLGRNFAKKNVVTVIPDYTLSPNANYDVMAKEIAEVIQWTIKNCEQYGGDPKQIFITGHSAGGHLAALAVMNPKYGIAPKSIAGIILNDAAGLDMKFYLESNPPTSENDYLTTWTNDPDQWKNASPIYFLNKETPPFLIYVGDKTYPSIKVANERFLKMLTPFQPNVQTIHLNKKHVPMVLQYFWPWNSRYDEIIDFMKKQSE